MEIKVKAIKPMFTAIVTTMDKYTKDDVDGKIITSRKEDIGAIKALQKVIAVGTAVRDIEVGDIVCVNPERYAQKKYVEDSVKNDILGQQIVGYRIPEIELDGKNYMYIDQRDIEYVVTEYEEIEPKKGSSIIIPNTQIIV